MSEAAGRRSPLDLPDRRLFWQWVWSAVRPFVGWALAAAGAIALLVGWYGVSGESLTSKQIPYLVSAGLTGIALFILAGVFLATDDIRQQFARIGELERKVDELHALFAVELASAGSSSTATAGRPAHAAPVLPADAVLALPSGSSYHRAGCALVAGKTEAAPVDAAAIARRGLRPCRVCDPGSAAAG
jgi:hypothetical protein